ncbi:hypothetical protein C8R45DRAFT_877360, partial [Mycena sanguinolenta]
MSNPPVPDPLVDPKFAGGPGGTKFEARGLQDDRFVLVKRLEMWWDGSARVRGMRITFSDDVATPIYGTTDINHSAIDFDMKGTAADPGPERVTKMWMEATAATDRPGRLGNIHIETSRGQTWDKGVAGKDRVQVDVGSGVFVGIVGRFGSDIDAAAPLFLCSPVAGIAVGNIVYTPHPKGSAAGLTPVTLNQMSFVNPANASASTDWTFHGSDARTVMMSHDITSTSIFGGSAAVEVSGEVFGVGAKATGGFEWSSETSQTTSTSTSEDIKFGWSISGKLEPGKAITCKAIVQRGALNLNHTSTVIVTLKNGAKFEYVASGVSKILTYS